MKFSDERIIEMLFDRDERALTYTNDKYGTLCQRIAFKIIGDYDEASDCVNNSLFQLWNAIPPARPESLKAFLCRIVRNVAINVGRKRTSYNETLTNYSELADVFCDCETTETVFDGKMLGAYINEFLSGQKELHQKIFVMRYYYNSSIQDISQTLNIKGVTVRTKLFRIRDELKQFLADKGYEL